MTKLYLDTETVGLNGPCKLIQYAVGEHGPVQMIKLPRGWKDSRDRRDHVNYLLGLCSQKDTTFIGFNAGFDLYHLYRVAHEGRGLPLDSHERPVAPFDCQVLDYYTHVVRDGPFAPWAFSKKTGKKVVAVRRVPAGAAEEVAGYVERLVGEHLPSGVKLVRSHHVVKGRKDLVTISWCAQASLGLKAHAEAYGARVQHIEDVWPLPPKNDKGGNAEALWLPYPQSNVFVDYDKLETECDFILGGTDTRSKKFFQYAEDDIHYLRLLEQTYGERQPDHHDAVVHATAYTRYVGFPVDRERAERTLAVYEASVRRTERELAGVNLRSSVQRLERLRTYEPWVANSSKATLTSLAKEDTPVGRCAKAMLGYGQAKQRLDQVRKVLESRTGRWHPDLRVMGTATQRAAGTSGFNAQGIAPAELVEGELIGLRTAILTPWGGDFASMELGIAASAWKDKQLLQDLDDGTDVHLITALAVHPDLEPLGLSYEEALRAKDDKKHTHHVLIKRSRTEAKRIVFGILYGAGPVKIAAVLGCTQEEAQVVIDKFFGRYKDAGLFRQSEELRFCTADTETWSPHSVRRMGSEAFDLTGAKRSFKFEAAVADALWQGSRLPREFSESLPVATIVRNPQKGPQTIHGAVRSAFMGAAISIQRAVSRAAINTPIQMTGGNTTKMLQAELWNRFRIPLLNVHDELIVAPHYNYRNNKEGIAACVEEFISRQKSVVRHIAFEAKETERWSDK